jgi:hypothetical protein
MYVQDILRKADKVFESREFFVAAARPDCGRGWLLAASAPA